MKKRLLEIEARKAELRKEVDTATQERLAEIQTETDGLISEETQIRSKMDLVGKLGVPESKPTDKPDEADTRASKIKESGKMELSVKDVRNALGSQKRSTTLATDSLAKPTGAGTDIKDTANTVSSIIDQVAVVDLTGVGSFEEPYVKSDSEAGTRTDGVANTASDPVFRVAAIKPYLVNVTSYVSKNIGRLTPTAYAEKVQNIAVKALRTKVAKLIVNGVAGEFSGIKIAVNTKAEAIYDTLVVDAATIGATTLRDIVFSYGGDENIGANARLFLTKEDLTAFGSVRGTNEKKAVYEITADAGNANTGIIKDGGTIVPYTINSGLTSLSTSVKGATAIQTMLYGDPANFELGLFGPYTIEVSKDYKFAEGLLTVMGEVMVGGNLIADKGFVVVTLGATA